MSKILFKSNINHNGTKDEISFESEVQVGEFNNFITYEFKEPQNNMMNRIEVSDSKVNIFAGPSSINLELNKKIEIKYQTPHGELFLDSFMTKLNNKNKNNVEFEYSLSKGDEVLGNYKILLQIK